MTEKIKNIISIIKEAALVLLFFTLFLFPSVVSNRLQEAGFYQGSFAGLDWKANVEKVEASKQQTLKNGHSVTQIQQNLQHLDSLVASLQNSDSFKSNPALKNIAKQIKMSADSVNVVDSRIKSNLILQQQFVNNVTDTKAASTGWIYLGKAKITGDDWEAANPKTIDFAKLSELKGQILSIKDDVYMRNGAKTSESVLDVISKNEKVRAIEIILKPSRNGKSVWAKVERLNVK